MLTIIQRQESATMEGLDNLFLLPERALTMDTSHLQKDLAGLDFDAHILHEAPMGNVWITGFRPSSARGGTLHWFAYVGPDPSTSDDREARIRSLKEKQNEERQKKLEEIKAQALAAQRFKEQKEQERRQRLEELRIKEEVRRAQVEERKKAINDAERDRLESILKRNQDRDARMEKKKRNERSSMVFAFGSSTPRMLEPTDSSGSFWGHRRATSTQNITCSTISLTRRQSERELDGGSKKRATSAGGLERSGEDMHMSTSMYEIFQWGEGTGPSKFCDLSSPTQVITRSTSAHFGNSTPQTPAGCVSGYVGRRRTDLMPTIPARDSSHTTPRKPFTRSPGRAYSMSRLDQLAKPRKRHTELPAVAEAAATNPSFRPLSRPQQSSVSRSMSHLAVSKLGSQQSQRPLRKSDSRSMHQLSVAAPLPPPRTTRATQLRQQKLAANNTGSEASSRPSSSLSQQSSSSITSSVNMRNRPSAAPRRQRPISIAVTGITHDPKLLNDKKTENKPPLPKSRKSSLVNKIQEKKKKPPVSPTEATNKNIIVSPTTSNNIEVANNINKEINKENAVEKTVLEKTESTELVAEITNTEIEENKVVEMKTNVEKTEIIDTDTQSENISDNNNEIIVNVHKENNFQEDTTTVIQNNMNNEPPKSGENLNKDDNQPIDMTASFTKVRINTEEEAKAALAERRRIAREEAERQAEMERLRIEEENRLEFERQQREEEQVRLLIEQQRAAEQERLEEAIRETKRREEEERLKREEELRLKLLKEEAERKAREEAEKQKAELQEKLEKEEKEREARRKRVEAIMLRTRGKNFNNPSQTDEKNEDNKSEKINGSKAADTADSQKNGKDLNTVDNIIPVDSIKNANTVNVDVLSTDDTINSNNAWQRNNTQSDLLM